MFDIFFRKSPVVRDSSVKMCLYLLALVAFVLTLTGDFSEI